MRNISGYVLAGVLAVMIAWLPAAGAQNRYEQEIPYRETDGRIVVSAVVDGQRLDFLLDVAGGPATALLEKHEGLLQRTDKALPGYPRGGINVTGSALVRNFILGDHVFLPELEVYVIKDDYLEGLGLAGVVGPEVFAESVLTINGRDRVITVSAPYKPSYVPLRNRTDIDPQGALDIAVDGTAMAAALDLLYGGVAALPDGAAAERGTGEGFGAAYNVVNGGKTVSLTIAGQEIKDVSVGTRGGDFKPMLGRGLLEYGIVSLDFAKGKAYFVLHGLLDRPRQATTPVGQDAGGNTIELDTRGFIENVFNYREGGQWKYFGDKPAVIDFWAEWCGPCKSLAPIFEQLAEEFRGDVVFYKVDIDRQKEIARYFNVKSIPMLLYIPLEGKPVPVLGLRPAGEIRNTINAELLGRKAE